MKGIQLRWIYGRGTLWGRLAIACRESVGAATDTRLDDSQRSLKHTTATTKASANMKAGRRQQKQRIFGFVSKVNLWRVDSWRAGWGMGWKINGIFIVRLAAIAKIHKYFSFYWLLKLLYTLHWHYVYAAPHTTVATTVQMYNDSLVYCRTKQILAKNVMIFLLKVKLSDGNGRKLK